MICRSATSTSFRPSKVGDPVELAEGAEAGRLKRDQLQGRIRGPRVPEPGRTSSRAIRLGSGASVTVAHPGGLDGGKLLDALRAVQTVVDAEVATPPVDG